jgi:hypothetical protein
MLKVTRKEDEGSETKPSEQPNNYQQVTSERKRSVQESQTHNNLAQKPFCFKTQGEDAGDQI